MIGSFDGSDHEVELSEGSLAAAAAGEATHVTLSHHHQGVDELGRGLIVSGTSIFDELPEAIELPDRSFVLGVQWHPEADEQQHRDRRIRPGCLAVARSTRRRLAPATGAEAPAPGPECSGCPHILTALCGCRRAIRATAWGIVAAGVAAPLVRRRVSAPPLVVQTVAFAAPVGMAIAVPRSKKRDVAICALQMWAYLAAYKTPHDDADAQEERVHVRYPIGDRPRARAGRAADGAPAAGARAHQPRGRGVARPGQGARMGALELVPGAARNAAVRARAQAVRVHARRRADLCGLRHRRELLLAHPHRAALVRGLRGQRGDARAAAGQAHDGGVRRVLLERRLGLALQCVRRQSPSRDALSALRHIRDGSAASSRGGAGGGRARLHLCGDARVCARVSRRALRGRSARGRAR